MTTAFTALLDLTRRLGILVEKDSYAASTNTDHAKVISTGLTESSAGDWLGSVVFITYDAGGASAAPEGEIGEVSLFTPASDTLTLGASFTTEVTAGDKFAITRPGITKAELYNALNDSLRRQGSIPQEDVSLTTISNTLEYTLPTAAVPDLRQVWVAMSTSDPYQWTLMYSWHVDTQSGKLIFDSQPPTPRKLKLIYQAPHASLTTPTGVLSPLLDYGAVLSDAYASAIWWLIQHIGLDSKRFGEMLNYARQEAQQARVANPIPEVPATPKVPSRMVARGSHRIDGVGDDWI